MMLAHVLTPLILTVFNQGAGPSTGGDSGALASTSYPIGLIEALASPAAT